MSLTAAAVTLLMSAAGPAPDAVTRTTPTTPIVTLPVFQGTSTDIVPSASPGGSVLPDPSASSAMPPLTTAATEPATQGSDIIVMRRKPPPPGDPLERVNEQSFKAVQAVDSALIGPVAEVYNKGLPRPVRQGLRNFFSNLNEPVVFVAYLLELKPGKAAETAGRFVINTTLGIGGLVDRAKRKPFNLPFHQNGLSNVLGYYGVGPGPYMYLPLVGPTTLRDIIGDTVDNALVPALVGKPLTEPAVVIPMSILNQLGERAAFDETLKDIRAQGNPYAYYRDLYLKQRKAEIDALHGRVTPDPIQVYGPGMPTAGKKGGALDGGSQSTPNRPGAVDGPDKPPVNSAKN
ncbi:MlaA family lipoprotein [Novosphingobium sp. Leaf2]|uniref:MlaA family lipoprotein n=1 Tax=Novosphingobium sp. Leaf2 TaxID=1735670 RepID=UPI0009E80423|nr:VacJ family lipoprotein [Novosphingobium sp. Leaf2]